MPETHNQIELQNSLHDPSNQEQAYSGRRLAAAIVLSATALTACSGGLLNRGSDMIAPNPNGTTIGQGAEDKTANPSEDIRHRATSVSFLGKGTLVGSGSLVKDDDGYKLATVEHVARGLYGMESNTPDGMFGVKPSQNHQPEPGDLAANIPGVGMVTLEAEPVFIGSHDQDDSEVSQDNTSTTVEDRYTEIPLSSNIGDVLQKAESQGTLSVPEKAPLVGKFGDVMTMPLADSGENIPFVVLEVSTDQATAELVPLYVLDKGLDYDKGMKNLQNMMQKVETRYDVENMQYDQKNVYLQAISQLQEELLKSITDDQKSKEASLWLPCMGDSGSPVLNTDKNVVGVLSRGAPFYQTGSNYDQIDSYVITRDGKNTIGRHCLSSVTIESVK